MFKDRKVANEYQALYVDFCNGATIDDVRDKELFIVYDEVLPDLYVRVEVNGKYVEFVDYDIYANRLQKVKLVFPNGAELECDIVDIRECERCNSLYNLVWEEPMIQIDWNGLPFQLSLVDILEQGVKAFVVNYSFEKEYDINE